jgi:hypothetical protein
MAGPSNSCHRPAGSGPPGREWDHTTSTCAIRSEPVWPSAAPR